MACTKVVALLGLGISLAFIGCEGTEGQQGPQGPAGTNGEDGANGQDGQDGVDGDDYIPAQYVGMEACASCHDEQYQQVIRSGHPYKLTFVDGAEPVPTEAFPGNYPPEPPDGYTWADVSYVIGGAAWKARFIDQEGYIITSGAAENPVQYNLEDGSWSTYHTGDEPGTKAYDCGACHTTGYETDGHQLDLPGIVGTWSEEGITCEACHGPGSNHVDAPESFDMRVMRDAAACGECHIRGEVGSIPASGGFIRHHEQWNEMANSRHYSLDCVTCHNPHQSAIYADDEWNSSIGMKTECESCHFQEAANQNTQYMTTLDCIDCHMPKAAKSALGDLEVFSADVASHTFAINPDPDAPQFLEDGALANAYLTLDYACRKCHSEGGMASEKTDEELYQTALGYHD